MICLVGYEGKTAISTEVDTYMFDHFKAGLNIANKDLITCGIDSDAKGTIGLDGIKLLINYAGGEVNYHLDIKGTALTPTASSTVHQALCIKHYGNRTNLMDDMHHTHDMQMFECEIERIDHIECVYILYH